MYMLYVARHKIGAVESVFVLRLLCHHTMYNEGMRSEHTMYKSCTSLQNVFSCYRMCSLTIG